MSDKCLSWWRGGVKVHCLNNFEQDEICKEIRSTTLNESVMEKSFISLDNRYHLFSLEPSRTSFQLCNFNWHHECPNIKHQVVKGNKPKKNIDGSGGKIWKSRKWNVEPKLFLIYLNSIVTCLCLAFNNSMVTLIPK